MTPRGLNKGDPNNQWCYQTIDNIVLIRINDYFCKVPKKGYDIDNSNFNQLDFLINYMLFTSSQYKIIENFNDKNEFKRLKIRFHAIFGKNESEVWSVVMIAKVMTILQENLFEVLLQNFHYVVLRANGVFCEFSIADFQLMN